MQDCLNGAIELVVCGFRIGSTEIAEYLLEEEGT